MGIQHLSRQLKKSAGRVMARCDTLGRISDEPEQLTRMFLSPAMRRTNELVGEWMSDAGLAVSEDTVFNLSGCWTSRRKKVPTLILGSHLDTVRDAGKYDGPLGVIVAIEALDYLRQEEVDLPFHVEIIGFCDEEGVRYQSTYLGSRAMAGTLTANDLTRCDNNHIALGDSGIGDVKKARRKRADTLAYLEVHIEQGPVLESKNLPVGIVTSIAGQTRASVEYNGCAAHAGTTPMHLRKDALAGAAEFMVSVEKKARKGLVATIGQITVEPGASNVIPKRTKLSLDIRHQNDHERETTVSLYQELAQTIARRRQLQCKWQTLQETQTVHCDPELIKTLTTSVLKTQKTAFLLPSGAGHDAAAMSVLTPVGMLFVRCKGGVSHHPDESVKVQDVAAAIAVLVNFILHLKKIHE